MARTTSTERASAQNTRPNQPSNQPSRRNTFLTTDRANFIAEAVCFEGCEELLLCPHFRKATILVKPLYVERRPSQWRCLRCQHNPRSGIGLHDHMLSEHHTKLTFVCPFCYEERNTVQQVAAHMRKRECNRTVEIMPLTQEELDNPPVNPCRSAEPLRPRLLEAIETLEDSTFRRIARESLFGRHGSSQVTTLADHLTRICKPTRQNTRRQRRKRRRRAQGEIEQEFRRNQWLWHRSKAKCYSKIMNGEAESNLDMVEADAFYRQLFGECGSCSADMIRVKPADSIPLSSFYIYQEEVEEYLRKKNRSAPGPDGLRASDLIPKAKEWTILVNLCLYHERIPRSWHASRTTLIPKCDSSLPSDHRPISVSSIGYRALASVLSRRLLHAVNLHDSQRGFIEQDGLHQAITTVRYLAAQRKPLVSIDLRKAFDSVPHETLLNACLANGLDAKSLRLISNIYDGATTTLQVGGRSSEPIMIRRGVRQGDPLSPILFNLTIDQVLRHLDQCNVGVKLGGRKLSALAYADDIIICADYVNDLHRLVEVATNSLSSLGMSVNWNKSFSVGTTLEGLPRRDAFKYLGTMIDVTGRSRVKSEDLLELVAKLDSGVIRGNQKLYFLRSHLLPTIYHRLTHESTTATTLREMAVLLRKYVRKWIKLPTTTSSSFIHLAVSSGGLGIPNLRWKLPETTRARMLSLQRCRTWYIQAVITTNWYRDELHRVDALCPLGGTEKWLLNDVCLANPGHIAFPTGGSRFANRHLTGASFIEGKKFYRFVQLRSMADNANTRRARTPLTCLKCHTGDKATLQHILCTCKDNEAAIRRRHDKVLQELIEHCRRMKFTYHQEPRLTDGLRPDLVVVVPDEGILCLDVTVVFELTRQSLSTACKTKSVKYSPCLTELSRQFVARPTRSRAYGLVFGARGSIAPQTLNILEKQLKVPRWRIDKMINTVVACSLELYEHSPLAPRTLA